MSNEVLCFIAGNVTYRLRHISHQLGIKTSDTSSFSFENKPRWVEWLSKGSLMIPSDWWLEQAALLEKEFNVLHGKDVSKTFGTLRAFFRHSHQVQLHPMFCY